MNLGIDGGLEGALLGGEGLAEALDRRLVRRGRQLELELGAKGVLGLGDELGADLRPRGGVGGLDRELGAGEVADFNLRFHCKNQAHIVMSASRTAKLKGW